MILSDIVKGLKLLRWARKQLALVKGLKEINPTSRFWIADLKKIIGEEENHGNVRED